MQKHWVILLKLAHKIKNRNGSICIICLWSLFFCLACNDTHNINVDKLNEMSYASHYRSIDRTIIYAKKAYDNSSEYSSGRAEALNNLAFANIARMNYDLASRQLDSIPSISDNQVELLIAVVQHMRLCQRQALNKNFYEYKERATRLIQRIREEENNLTPHMVRRLIYAKTEYAFVTSTYYFYVGLMEQSRKALNNIKKEGLMQKDTAQYLDWLYQTGSGGMLQKMSSEATLQKEYELLLECYMLAKRHGYMYWEANALQALSELLFSKNNLDFISKNNKVSLGFLNTDGMPDTLLAGYLAQKSLDMFVAYGDTYQTAGSIRTLAKCYWGISDYKSAIYWLKRSLELGNGKIRQAPDLVASIREQLCIVYSSINDKYNSDLNRNIYLDMQEKTRQDMELDARASQLDKTAESLNLMILGILILIFLISILISKLLRNKEGDNIKPSDVDKAICDFSYNNEMHEKKLAENNEELQENLELSCFDNNKNKERNIENRARVFLVESIKPLVDRIMGEIERLIQRSEPQPVRSSRYKYIVELTETINEYNDVLTNWIQLHQGEIGLHIESFPLNDVFETVSHSKTIFSIQKINLVVSPTDFVVKADKVLTLFMVNTIVDNARKFTSQGGQVEVSATDNGEYVEISIRDTGKGMSADELQSVFSREINNEHGFGLLNCRGILNRYKKYSNLFERCSLSAESAPNKGSRFFFTLPKGVIRISILLFALMRFSMPIVASGNEIDSFVDMSYDSTDYIAKASAFVDSAYYSNIEGTFMNTLSFADSARHYYNLYYITLCPNGKYLMKSDGDVDGEIAEIEWLHSGFNTDFPAILSMRNECAIAALALHCWDLYNYNNVVYTKLFKEVSADKSLGEYCRIMQKSETNKNIAIVILVILLFFLLSVCYVIYYRKTVRRHGINEIYSYISNVLKSETKVKEKIDTINLLKDNPYYNNIITTFLIVQQKLVEAFNRQEEIEFENFRLIDEIKRISYEKDRLYVSNNILENCLSAIKHETMYYPARIKKYVEENKDCEMSIDKLKTLNGIVKYYKELYFMFCLQLHKQVENIAFNCRMIDISDNTGIEGLSVYGDKFILNMLFNIIKKQNKGRQPVYTIKSKSKGHLTIQVLLVNYLFPEAGTNSLFLPSENNLPFMVCRQIIREIENGTNRFGCGITAERGENNQLQLDITLPA